VSDGFIVYSRESAVVAHPFDEHRGDLTGDPVVIVDNVSSGVRSGRAAFTVSENGLLAYTSNYRVNSTQLTWFSRTGQRLGTIGEAAPFSRMAVSPDERTVVVGRVDRNGGRSLWTVEPARQVMTRLTFGGQGQDLDDFPRWSPDGKRLIYGGTRAGDTSLYEIPAGGGQPRVVLKSPGPFAEAEDWSPDGRTIVYRLSPQLWALPLQDGAKPFLVYERGGAARFSPDGKWLAFDSNESGIYQVNVVPFPPTGAKWQVSADGGEKPQWRRDGRELFFLAPDGKMMAVDVRLGETFEAGAPRTLFQAVAPTVDLGQYAATGDGQRFLIMMPAESTYSDEIQVIVDWPGLIQKR
jgi:Tol biopolymer transport system component